MDDSTYSRLIGGLKIALPILALALLSTLFLVARTVDPAQRLPFAEVVVDEIARESRIGAPNFAGVTEDGSAVAFAAKSAAPDPEDAERVQGQTIQAEIDLPDGERIQIAAGQMTLAQSDSLVELREDVRITSDEGYLIDTDQLEVALDRTYAASSKPTRLTGAIAGGAGELTADSFELKPAADTGSLSLVFKGGVRLLYTPGRPATP